MESKFFHKVPETKKQREQAAQVTNDTSKEIKYLAAIAEDQQERLDKYHNIIVNLNDMAETSMALHHQTKEEHERDLRRVFIITVIFNVILLAAYALIIA